MRKSEIKPFTPLVRRGFDIRPLLLRRHGIPASLTLRIAPDVVDLDGDCKHGIPRNDAQDGRVAASIVRLVVFAVYLSQELATNVPFKIILENLPSCYNSHSMQ